MEDQGRPKLKSQRGLASELEQAFGQENMMNFGQENIPSPPRPQIQRSDLLRNKLTGALQRTAEKMRVVHLQAGQSHDQPGFTPGFKNILEIPYTHASPVKSMRRCLEEASPLRGVRRALGEITPSKNCQDQTDLELPFTFDLVGQGLGVERLPAMPSTPRAREETSPSQLGSPMLKLKKRFQERFQEEKERGEELARPIAWTEEEETGALQEHLQDSLLTTPVRRRRSHQFSNFSSSWCPPGAPRLPSSQAGPQQPPAKPAGRIQAGAKPPGRSSQPHNSARPGVTFNGQKDKKICQFECSLEIESFN